MVNLLNNSSQTIKITLAFVALFLLYHLAEYMIMFQNNVLGFFIFQALFFTVAWLFGKWYNRQGLNCWGLSFSRDILRNILIGIVLGLTLYAVPFVISLFLGIETIVNIPDTSTIIMASLPFAFGVIFSSFSEDILTRGLIFTHFKAKITPIILILLSAIIYVLNHIYRLNDGADTLLYLFLLGIILIIALNNTKNLWLTGSMHWAGNTFFFITHNVIQTENGENLFSGNYVFAIWMIFFIPIVWYVSNWKYLSATEK